MTEIRRLVEARQRAGLSLESIADRTKITMFYLRAIEAQRLSLLPEGIYRVSFLKQYAQAIDPELAACLERCLAARSSF